MILTKLSVHRPVTTMMAVLAVATGGVLALFNLPVDLMPNVESKMVTVFVGVRGGMPSEDIEHLITEPIEEAVATMAGLESLLSVSRKDRSTVTLNFDESVDVKRASLDVSERLARIKGKLPREIEKPIVARYNENEHPIVILSATSSIKTPEVLRTMIEHDLKPQLSRISGVANVEIGGGRQRKILVEFEKAKLEAYQLSILDVIRELSANNLNLTSGKYESQRDAWGVQFQGDFKTLEEMKALGVSITKSGSRIRLNDVAVVRDYYLEPESIARVNSQPSVSIYIQKESGANTIRTAQDVLRLVRDYEKTLPSDVGIGISVDQSVAIRQSIADIRHALTWGALLTALVLWFFLKNLKQVGVILFSIPVAVLGTFFVMLLQTMFVKNFTSLPSITINVMSLLGVALGIGRMVDDSIVVFENILHRNEIRRSRGEKFSKADAIEATAEMALAVASSTLVMVVIFLPIIFISADVRRLYSDVAFTVVTALMASLLMAFTVVPLLAAFTMPGPGQTIQDLEFEWEKKFRGWSKEKWPSIETGIRDQFIRFGKKKSLLGRLPHGSYKSGAIQDPREAGGGTRKKWSYAALVRKGTAWSIRHRFGLMVGILISLVASLAIYFWVIPKEYMASGEKREFVILVEMKTGTKLDISDKVVSAVEAEINSLPEVKKVVKTVQARVEGWSSKVYVTLNPGAERSKSAQEIIQILRERLKNIGQEYDGTFIHFSEASSEKELIIDVYGRDYIELKNLAVDIAKRIEGIKGLHDVNLRYKPGQEEKRLEVDHARASMFGLNSKDIADSLHAQVRGLRATYFNTGNDQVETVARLSEEDRRTMEQIANLSLLSNGQNKVLVPIRQVINFEDGLTPSEVWRKNKERMIQVSANREKLPLTTAVEQVKKKLVGLNVPIGYHYEVGGDYKKLLKSEREFAMAFIVMVLMVYIVLACFFESYTQPLLMLLSLPLATAGSIPTLWATHTTVNMGVYIGLLMLGGTVVSNAIILIDRLNVVRQTRGLLRSVLKVGIERSRPIFMTSGTTIAAMLPLTLQVGESADLWAPLALTVVSGLFFSSILTLFVVPAAYVILDGFNHWMAKVSTGETSRQTLNS